MRADSNTDVTDIVNAGITVLTTGGTIDKVYFDAKSQFEIGDSVLEELLREAHVDCRFHIQEVMRKDSLEITDQDRHRIATAVADAATLSVVITHGTDTLTHTAQVVDEVARSQGKTVVLTGALSPARFAKSDATFNVGMAFAAAQCLEAGAYIVMNGQVFGAGEVRKDVAANKFVPVSS